MFPHITLFDLAMIMQQNLVNTDTYNQKGKDTKDYQSSLKCK